MLGFLKQFPYCFGLSKQLEKQGISSELDNLDQHETQTEQCGPLRIKEEFPGEDFELWAFG